MEYRPYYLAREWVRRATGCRWWRPTSRTCAPASPTAGDESIDGIAYRWLRHAALPAATAWAGCATSGPSCAAVWADTPRLVREFRPDVVIASSTYPMDIWVARRLARARRREAGLRGARPVAAEPDRTVGHVALAPVHRAVPGRRRRRLPRRRRRGVACCPRCTTTWRRAGSTCSKLAIVPNGITLDEWQGEPAPLRQDVAQALAAARAAGAHGGGLRRLAWACPTRWTRCWTPPPLLRDAPLRFVLVGSGHEQARLAQRVAAEGLHQVRLAAAHPQGADPGLPGRRGHRLHRLAARAHLPLRHRAQQADGLHDGGLRRAALGGGRQRPRGRGRLRPHRAAAGSPPPWPTACAGWPRCPPTSAAPWVERGRAFVLAHHTYPVLAQRFLEAAALNDETRAVAERYARRAAARAATACCAPRSGRRLQERQRAMLRCFGAQGITDLARAAHHRGRLRRRRQPAGTAAPGLRGPSTSPGSNCCPSATPPARQRAAGGQRRVAGRRHAAPRRARQPGHRAAVHRVLVAARRRLPAAPGRRDVALAASPAAPCSGTTSPWTTRATPTCAACRWRRVRQLFPARPASGPPRDAGAAAGARACAACTRRCTPSSTRCRCCARTCWPGCASPSARIA